VSKRPTRDDVARLAGVSVATVSYVVNDGPKSVAPKTRAKVLAAIKELNYKPHSIARSLKTGNTNTIGLLFHSVISPGSAYIANVVQSRLAEHGYSVILATTHGDHELERRMLDVLTSQSIDGLIMIPTSSHNRDRVIELKQSGIPVVFVDRIMPGVDVDVVMSDNVKAASLATEYLIKQGRRDIVCISFSSEASSAIDRVEGYRRALAKHSLPVAEKKILLSAGPRDRDAGTIIMDYVDRYGLPDAILCTRQMIAIEVVKVLKERGIRIPEDVAIIGGFFNSPWNALLDPPLPLVNQDLEYMSELAVDFLIERINGDDAPPRTVLLDAELIIR
jgi:LacI family transcriptional regulator